MKNAAAYFKCLSVSVSIALAALLVFCVLPAPPVMAAPVLQLNVSSGAVGTQITITGTVFDSYEGDSIHILFDTTEINAMTVPSTGTFSTSWTIPADTAAGQHTFVVKQETSGTSFIATADFTIDPRQLTLNTNEGPTGTVLTITGSGFYINEGVTLSYYNPDAAAIGTVTATSLGGFTRTYTVPASPAGSHTIHAENARGNTADTTFRVTPGIELNADSGASGEQVTVHGTGFGKLTNVTLSLDTVTVAVAPADAYGTMDSTFTIPTLTVSTHYLKARDNLGNAVQVIFPVTAGAVLSETTGSTGAPLTVNGNGFQSGSNIIVKYDDTQVASVTADSNGKFTITFDVPQSTGGDHVITVTDGNTTKRYSFTVETTPPPVPTPLSPAAKSISGDFPTLSWQPVTDPSVPVTYEVEIAEVDDFTSVTLHKTGIQTTHYTVQGGEALKADIPVTIYYWRVMAIDGAGNRGDWSAASSFVVAVPAAPTLTLPGNGAKIDFPINLNWTTVTSPSGEVTYNVQVSQNEQFNQLLIDEKGISSGLYIVTPENKRIFDKKTPYYWRVRAIDAAGNPGQWSDAASFQLSSFGFPAWAVYTLIGLGAVIMIIMAYRYGRKTAYH